MKLILIALVTLAALGQEAGKPETVMVTAHAKSGGEAELQKVLARHWATARDLKLVAEAPHMSLRGVDASGKTYFVEIFTWRDAAIPDHAPPAIQAIWSEMAKLVEGRGVEIAEVTAW